MAMSGTVRAGWIGSGRASSRKTNPGEFNLIAAARYDLFSLKVIPGRAQRASHRPGMTAEVGRLPALQAAAPIKSPSQADHPEIL